MDKVGHMAARSLRSRYIANPSQTIAYTPPAPCISPSKGLSPARGSPDPCPRPPPVHSTRRGTGSSTNQWGYRKQHRRRGGWWVYRSIMQAIIGTIPIGAHQPVMHWANRHSTANRSRMTADHRYFANCEEKNRVCLHDSVMQAMCGYKFYLGKILTIVQF